MAADPISRIWLTYKTRIISERRYQRYAIVSHLALSWYAFLSIVFSIYQDRFAQSLGVVGASQAALVMSVLTFGLSLIIYGLRFDDLARIHRECYISMQRVYQSQESDDVKLERYSSLLEHYPNHSDSDYDDLLFDAWRFGRTLSGTDGQPILFGWRKVVASYFRHFVRNLATFSLFFIPLGFSFFGLWGS
ncbi:SLATT domain-containing protein [Sphingobium yanoikuyae]|uniref:SLATT domain-containing protein n=2 Tax=Sphingobium TaxID=165695 RepID=UPI00242F96F1|nr:SLATT domain-containing protein [Sphingobium yanoikuyae]